MGGKGRRNEVVILGRRGRYDLEEDIHIQQGRRILKRYIGNRIESWARRRRCWVASAHLLPVYILLMIKIIIIFWYGAVNSESNIKILTILVVGCW